MASREVKMFYFALLKVGASLEMKLSTGVSFPGMTPLVSAKFPATASLPILKLPYATYEANSYDAQNDIYVFANIRVAAPPNGTLRWRAIATTHPNWNSKWELWRHLLPT